MTTLIELHQSLADENGRITVWPDGKPFLDQPVQLTRAFDRIGSEIVRWRKQRRPS